MLQYGARKTHDIRYQTPTSYDASHSMPWHEAITLTLSKFVVNIISGNVSEIATKDLCALTSVFIRESACLQWPCQAGRVDGRIRYRPMSAVHICIIALGVGAGVPGSTPRISMVKARGVVDISMTAAAAGPATCPVIVPEPTHILHVPTLRPGMTGCRKPSADLVVRSIRAAAAMAGPTNTHDNVNQPSTFFQKWEGLDAGRVLTLSIALRSSTNGPRFSNSNAASI
jgi:hypothetical protein